MSHSAQLTSRDNLVHRYAARKHARFARERPAWHSMRRRTGLQTFGRVPVSPKRAGSIRSRRAVTTLMATAIMATSAPAVSAGQSSHEVQEGETLSGIARDHGTTIEELVQINGIEDPDRIIAGANLQLDDQQDVNESDIQEGDTVYQVKDGDTLYAIAQEHGVSVDDLIALNELDDTDTIYVDDYLIIPTSAGDDDDVVAEPQESDESTDTAEDDEHIVSLHLVARGESPGAIANRYSISVEQLLAANDLDDDDDILAGSMLRIPDESWEPNAQPADVENQTGEEQADGTILNDMGWHEQSLAQSSAPAAASIATSYWGHPVSEWVFIENMPYHQNPHRGYRGDMDAASGGTGDYGVYPKPLSTMLANYGFVGDEFYTMGDPEALKDRIDQGQPVLVWMTEGATPQNRHFEWYQGERFTLVPHQQVMVAYGYDDEQIYVSDPATGEYVAYSWDAFINSWSLFDGMSMAVYPKG